MPNNLIEVVLKEGDRCRMTPRALDVFLSRDMVAAFKRYSGWAVVGVDTVRGQRKGRSYNGPERRTLARRLFRVSRNRLH